MNALLTSWLPVLLMVAFWVIFVRYFNRRGGSGFPRECFVRQKEHWDRVEQRLERIATALERR